MTWDAVDNPGSDGDGLSQCDIQINGSQFQTLFGYSGSGPGRLGTQSGNFSGDWPTGTTATIICQAVDGAPPGIASSTVPVPPNKIQAQVVDGYHFTGSLGGSTCHDGLHPWILCISWNVYQDDGINHNYGIPGATGTGSSMRSCDIYFNSANYGSGRDSYNATNAPTTSGNPLVFHYWNYTLGWYGDPGTVTWYVQCQSSAWGNNNEISNNNSTSTWSSGFCITDAGSGCNGTGAGGGVGSGGSSGGGDSSPPPPTPCSNYPYAGGTFVPSCYCLYPGGAFPNCAPPPGGGGGCGINLPGNGRLYPEFGFLSFVPYMGFIIC